MAKLTLGDITGGYQTADQYNANNALIEAAIENTISRDGASPNMMDALFDMNSYDINNVGITRTERLFLNGQEASISLGALFGLDGLTDVTITAAAEDDALMYNAVSGEWENRPLVEADISDHGSYDPAGTDNSTDVTLSGTGTYLTLVGQDIQVDPITESDITDLQSYLLASAVSTFGGTLIDDLSATAARTTLGVDPAGTDNSTDVTLVGTGTYLSIAGQAITVDPITESDISDLVAYLPLAGGTLTGDLTVGAQNINIGVDTGGDSLLNFYDDTNNTFRSIFWDDSESAFFFEDDAGAFQQFGTGSGGGPDFLLGGM